MNLETKAVAAGIFFGIWPLLMNRSGLSGNVSSLVFAILTLLCVLPFALYSGIVLTEVNWAMCIAAGLTAGIGVLFFNGMLAKATTKQVGSLFVIMIVIQTMIPAVYQAYQNGSIPATKSFGFVLAIIAGVLLSI